MAGARSPPLSGVSSGMGAAWENPFGLQVPSLQLVTYLELSDLASIAACGPVAAAAFRAASPPSFCASKCGAAQPHPEGAFHGEAMDLVCCMLAAAMRSSEARLCLERADGKTALTLAARAGRPDVVRWLLQDPDVAACVDRIDSGGASALHYAALHGHEHVCEVLLAAGACPDVADSTGIRPLHLAAEHGHLRCCIAMLSSGADVNARDSDASTPLLLAVEEGQIEACRLLTRLRADPLASNRHGRTPMAVAAESGSPLLLNALETSLWPQARQRCAPLVLGPEAIEIMRRAMRLR